MVPQQAASGCRRDGDRGPEPAPLRSNEMTTTHKGACFCGTVEIEVAGEPEGMGYCHCRSCRSWSGGPVNAFSLWKPEAVRVSSGAERIATFKKSELSERQYCTKCGGHLMTRH